MALVLAEVGRGKVRPIKLRTRPIADTFGRVVWYAYEGEDRYFAFVKALIAVLGNKDEIQCVSFSTLVA